MPNLDAKSFLSSIAQNEGIDLKELFRRILLRMELVYKNCKKDELVEI